MDIPCPRCNPDHQAVSVGETEGMAQVWRVTCITSVRNEGWPYIIPPSWFDARDARGSYMVEHRCRSLRIANRGIEVLRPKSVVYEDWSLISTQQRRIQAGSGSYDCRIYEVETEGYDTWWMREKTRKRENGVYLLTSISYIKDRTITWRPAL